MLRMILHIPRRKTNNDTTQHTQTPPTVTATIDTPSTTTTTDDSPPTTTTTTAGTLPTDKPQTHPRGDSDDSGSDVDSNPDTPQKPQLPDDHDTTTDLEPWVDWIRRCTHDAENRMKKMNLDDWVTIQRRRKWRWPNKVASTTHDTWTTIALQWDPTLDTQLHARRRTGHPKTRWTDDVKAHVRHTSTHARDNTTRHNFDHDNNNGDRDANADGDTNTWDKGKVANKLHQNYEVPWTQLAADKQRWSDMESGYITRTVP